MQACVDARKSNSYPKSVTNEPPKMIGRKLQITFVGLPTNSKGNE